MENLHELYGVFERDILDLAEYVEARTCWPRSCSLLSRRNNASCWSYFDYLLLFTFRPRCCLILTNVSWVTDQEHTWLTITYLLRPTCAFFPSTRRTKTKNFVNKKRIKTRVFLTHTSTPSFISTHVYSKWSMNSQSNKTSISFNVSYLHVLAKKREDFWKSCIWYMIFAMVRVVILWLYWY